MANEASIIENPTSTPAAVSTGYQRQNTLITGIMNGIDRTVVEGGAGGVTVQISGPVDVNGVLYSVTSAASLSCPAAGKYIVYLDGTTGTLTPTLSTSLGTFDDSKNARYTAGGKRILNWLIFYDGTTAYVNRWVTPESGDDNNYLPDLDTQPETWITASGNWTAPRTKYYTIYVTGHGGGGAASTAQSGGSGATGIIRKLISAGDVWTATMSTANGGNTVFSDGTTTLTVQNGTVLTPGAIPSGFDVNIGGGYGAYNFAGSGSNFHGGTGGASIYGSGGRGGDSTSPYDGYAAIVFGAGGGGGVSSSYSQGAGGSGAIRIVG
jgi:hypothetical protein